MMSISSSTREEATSSAHFSRALSGVLQRKCACGGLAGLGSSCESCKAREVSVPQRSSMSGSPSSLTSADERNHGHEDWDLANHSRSGHDFSRFPVQRSRSAGRMSMHVSPVSPTSVRNQTEMSDEDPEEQTTVTGTESGNRISVTFDPTTSVPRPQCDQIILTQWIQMTADGSSIMPGTYYTPFTCRNPTTLTDATYLDHGSCAYTTPYPVDRGIGTSGSSNGTVSNATYSDAPSTGGGDRGFNSAANPTGWNTVTYLFGNYAFCAAGTECGTWYDGIQWNYTKTAADHAAGRSGTAMATASAPAPGPGATIIAAFDQYNSAKGFTPCLYSGGP